MTTQPRIALDDLTSDALDTLYDRLAALENGARERSALLEEARDALEAAGIYEAHGGDSWPRLVPAIEELAAERDRLAADNARLTAGQCTDSRAMCEQHHLPPVAGCPYPRCRAARDRDQRAATA